MRARDRAPAGPRPSCRGRSRWRGGAGRSEGQPRGKYISFISDDFVLSSDCLLTYG